MRLYFAFLDSHVHLVSALSALFQDIDTHGSANKVHVVICSRVPIDHARLVRKRINKDVLFNCLSICFANQLFSRIGAKLFQFEIFYKFVNLLTFFSGFTILKPTHYHPPNVLNTDFVKTICYGDGMGIIWEHTPFWFPKKLDTDYNKESVANTKNLPLLMISLDNHQDFEKLSLSLNSAGIYHRLLNLLYSKTLANLLARLSNKSVHFIYLSRLVNIRVSLSKVHLLLYDYLSSSHSGYSFNSKIIICPHPSDLVFINSIANNLAALIHANLGLPFFFEILCNVPPEAIVSLRSQNTNCNTTIHLHVFQTAYLSIAAINNCHDQSQSDLIIHFGFPEKCITDYWNNQELAYAQLKMQNLLLYISKLIKYD